MQRVLEFRVAFDAGDEQRVMTAAVGYCRAIALANLLRDRRSLIRADTATLRRAAKQEPMRQPIVLPYGCGALLPIWFVPVLPEVGG